MSEQGTYQVDELPSERDTLVRLHLSDGKATTFTFVNGLAARALLALKAENDDLRARLAAAEGERDRIAVTKNIHIDAAQERERLLRARWGCRADQDQGFSCWPERYEAGNDQIPCVCGYNPALRDLRAAQERERVLSDQVAIAQRLFDELERMRHSIPVDWPTGITGRFMEEWRAALDDARAPEVT